MKVKKSKIIFCGHNFLSIGGNFCIQFVVKHFFTCCGEDGHTNRIFYQIFRVKKGVKNEHKKAKALKHKIIKAYAIALKQCKSGRFKTRKFSFK